MEALKLAFVSGLSDKKLAQKLAPLQAMPEVSRIDLYRRQPFCGDKIRWMPMPRFCSAFAPCGDLWRFAALLKNAPRYNVLLACHQFYHGIYAALAGTLRARPVIQLAITDPMLIQRSFLGRWALRGASAVGFRGHISRDRFRAQNGNRQQLFVIRNVWKPLEQLAGSQKSIDLLYVGNFSKDKNLPAWFETAAGVKRSRGSLAAVLVGDRPNRRIVDLVNRLNLSDNVDFTGPLFDDELDQKYASARVFLLTSRWEGLPMVALEAMAAGVPLVTTDVGDIRELVKDGENGYVTAVGDVNAAASAVGRLLNDEKLHFQISQGARESASFFLSESTLECVKKTWQHVFSKLGLV
jgi:glycosyltransferase involved in cell wall biosynthesis